MSSLPNGGKEKDLTDSGVAALTPPGAVVPAAAAAGQAGDGWVSRFVPGVVFAGRYRMIGLLGRGGMGEVWHAEDQVLQTAVALKVIPAEDPRARERIFREVRLARQITHPAVCRVFDVGEAEDQVFYSMELVRGEDLATLLRRIGRLPSEKVVEIGRQLCAALAAAHEQGVLHRDLKPANVLIDEDGAVRITDFGIAITRGDAAQSVIIGTPGYMAPEQLAGLKVTEATDLYALGVVLYELLVGERPFEDFTHPGTPPIAPSARVDDVDPRLDQLILQLVAAEPRHRPASAAEVTHRLELNGPAARRRVRWPWFVLAAVVVIGIGLGLASIVFVGSGRTLTDQDTIVLADFMNTTGEPVFDGALKVALAVALEQSPFLKVFPDDRVRETLRLMERPADERITRVVAREIARREQLKALVSGSIGSLGSNYVLTLEAFNAETGDAMAREQVEVASKEDVLKSLGTATTALRQKLGESLGSVRRFDVPLARATTASLDALHAYSLALDQGTANLRREAIPNLQRAIELDPNFAMAYALLSAIYANTGQTGEAPVYARRAFELRDRVSERERYFLSWRYYIDASQSWDKALDLARSWTATYPREAFAFNSLGLASGAFGQFAESATAFEQAKRLDARFIPPYGNLTGSLIALNRFEDAKAARRDAEMHRVDGTGLRRAGYVLAFLDGDTPAMTRELDRDRDSSSAAVWVSVWNARTTAFAGRVRAAHDLFRLGVAEALRQELPELAAQWTMEDAETHAIVEQCDDARREVAAGLELTRDNFTLERAARTLAVCGAEPGALTAELASRFPDATLTTRIQLPVIAATVALRRKESARAVQLLEPVTPYDDAPSAEFWPTYLRGQAWLQSNDGARAADQFRRILSHRGAAPSSPLYPLAHLGAARAAMLTGDTAAAKAAYDAFFAVWKDADDSLPLTTARRESARLR